MTKYYIKLEDGYAVDIVKQKPKSTEYFEIELESIPKGFAARSYKYENEKLILDEEKYEKVQKEFQKRKEEQEQKESHRL